MSTKELNRFKKIMSAAVESTTIEIDDDGNLEHKNLLISSNLEHNAIVLDASTSPIDAKNSANDTDEVNYSSFNNQNVLIERHGGLSNRRVFSILALWYLFSALTLFTNKYLVSHGKGDPTLLGILNLSNMVIKILNFDYLRCCTNDNYEYMWFCTNKFRQIKI